MSVEKINGQDLQKMLAAGLALLNTKYKDVDLLNVFPVPDGDTGTNMYLTLNAAVEEVSENSSLSVGKVAAAASRGALMGARGNSGVILSQLMRGFSLSISDKEIINGKELAIALAEGVRIAVKAVMRPVEGTILTVAREASKAATMEAKRNNSIELILEKTCVAAEETLNKTPDILPALKEAGVVDAGGMGWLIILQGFYKGITGDAAQENLSVKAPVKRAEPATIADTEDFNFEFPYCTEILLKGTNDTAFLTDKLQSMGDSLLIAPADDLIKVHVHTAQPDAVLGVCLKYGILKNVKINNMNEQAAELSEKLVTDKEQKPFGIVSVASGEGISEIMLNLGADKIISGGQSMNPSIQELVKAVETINSDNIIILPNNSNIILSANQVQAVTPKNLFVVPTKTLPEGIAALLAVTPELKPDDLFKTMSKAASGVKSGEVTYAVRDTTINGNYIEKGNILGLYNDEMVVAESLPGTVAGLIEKMITPEDEVCSIYYGNMVNKAEAEVIMEDLTTRYPNIDFELHYGGQPVYYFLISVE